MKVDNRPESPLFAGKIDDSQGYPQTYPPTGTTLDARLEWADREAQVRLSFAAVPLRPVCFALPGDRIEDEAHLPAQRPQASQGSWLP
jgi:hypothetical protein